MTDRLIELSKKYPLSFIVDIAEDNEHVIQKLEALLDANNIPKENRRKFLNPEEYNATLSEFPHITPMLAILDYKYDGYGLTGYDLMLTLVKRTKKKARRTRCIMITGYKNPTTMANFFHKGGYGWVDKYRPDFDEVFVELVLEAINEYFEMLEDVAFIEDVTSDDDVESLISKKEISRNGGAE